MTLRKDGSPDMRYSVNRNAAASEATAKSLGYVIAFAVILILLMAVITYVPFLLLTMIYTGHLKHKLVDKRHVRRINNIASAAKPYWIGFITSGLFSFSAWASYTYFGEKYLAVWFLVTMVWLNFITAKWISVIYLGVIVDPKRDRVFFRQDNQSYDFLDYVSFKWLWNLQKITSVKISEIQKISKQYGDYLYLIGDFGSRRIMFTNKQKRDECVYALQKASGARMMYNFDMN